MRRLAVCGFLLAVVLASLTMAAIAVRAYPAYWSQPGARRYVAEAAGALLPYAAGLVWALRRRGAWWDSLFGIAAVFGAVTGCMEVANVASENGLLPGLHGAAPQIGSELLVFVVWGVAGWRAARVLGTVRAGVAAAALSAGMCMVIAVAAGFLMEFFVAPPAPGSVAVWGEYLRSGWTDPRAFAVANTLDSACTHLLLGPIVGVVFGAVGAWGGSVKLSKAVKPQNGLSD